MDWADHNAIMLFAHPRVQQGYDDWIRAWNPNAGSSSGAVDTCGWPASPSASLQVRAHVNMHSRMRSYANPNTPRIPI